MLKKILFLSILVIVISLNFQSLYAEIFYPTTNVRLKGPSTYCVNSEIDEISQETSARWVKLVDKAVREWEFSLKDAEITNDEIWTMSSKIYSDDGNGCDINIQFQDKPELSDTVAGYFSYPPGKIVIYYLQPKMCNSLIPCYDGKTLKPDDAIYAIALHEIGHSLGLDHYVSDDNDLNKKWQLGNETPPSVMIPTIPRTPDLLQITDLDVKKIQLIYGDEGFYAFSKSKIPTPEPIPKPNPEPEPKPNPEPIPEPEPIIPLTPFDSMDISQKIIEVNRYGQQIITLSGKVSENEFHRGLPAIITIHNPDDTVEVLKIKTTGDRYFETLLIFDRESIRGTYHISASYSQHVDKNMDITFQVIEEQVDSASEKPSSSIIETKNPKKEESKNEKIIPEWVKNNAGWWANGQIGDHAFLSGIQYLIKENILKISNIQENSKSVKNMPVWVKNIAGFWTEDKISDEEFVKSIQYLIENKLIIVS